MRRAGICISPFPTAGAVSSRAPSHSPKWKRTSCFYHRCPSLSTPGVARRRRESVSCAGIIGHSNAPLPSALISNLSPPPLPLLGEIFILARIYISPSNVRSRTSPLSYSRSPRDSPLDSRGGWRGRKGEDSATLLVQGHLSEVIFAVHSRAKIAKYRWNRLFSREWVWK